MDKNGVRELLAPLGTKMPCIFISHGQGLGGGGGPTEVRNQKMLAAPLRPGS